jgi:hypothetical protein
MAVLGSRLQAAWNASLYVRHDHTTLHVSEVEDSGDAIDATFRVISGCHSALMGTAGGSHCSGVIGTTQPGACES